MKTEIKTKEQKTGSKKKVIVRTYSAGVWYGNIKKLDGTVCVLKNARRLWQWYGAASLSELAVSGTKQPTNCKFCITITDEDGVYLPQVIEVLPVSKSAQENIDAVRDWVA